MPEAPNRSSATGNGTVRQTWQPGPSDRPARTPRTGRWLKGGAAALTFLLAVVGAVTGFIGFLRSEHIDVDVTARQTTFDYRAFDIGIVNNSQRAVSVTGGTLTFNGEAVGQVARFVPGLGAADPRSETERLAAAYRPPFALAAGQAFAGAVEWVPPTEAYSATALDQLGTYLGRARGGDARSGDRFKLVLKLQPGGEHEVPVRLVSSPDDRRPQVGHALGWYTMLVLDGERRARGLTVYLSEQWPKVASLQVWGRAAAPLYTATRPLVSSDRTSFALPRRLSSGEFTWAVTVGGDTVAAGRYRSPCPPGSSASNRYHEVHSDDCIPRVP